MLFGIHCSTIGAARYSVYFHLNELLGCYRQCLGKGGRGGVLLEVGAKKRLFLLDLTDFYIAYRGKEGVPLEYQHKGDEDYVYVNKGDEEAI